MSLLDIFIFNFCLGVLQASIFAPWFYLSECRKTDMIPLNLRRFVSFTNGSPLNFKAFKKMSRIILTKSEVTLHLNTLRNRHKTEDFPLQKTIHSHHKRNIFRWILTHRSHTLSDRDSRFVILVVPG